MEMVLYVMLFVAVGGLMTGITLNSLRVSTRENANTEVVQQLDFVMSTVQKLVGDASLVEAVYQTDGDNIPTNDPTVINQDNDCDDNSVYCTLKLRFENDNLDPTWVVASSTGVYLVSGDDDEAGDTPLTQDSPTTDRITTDAVLVDFLRFTKYELPSGHALAKMNLSLTYNTDNPKFRITRSIVSAIGRVTAATFDDSLVPNDANVYDIGALGGLEWRSLILGSNLIMAEGSAPSASTGYGKLYVNSTNKGLHFMNSAGVTAPVSLSTDTKCLWLSDPADTDDLKSVWIANGFSATITKIWCESDQTVNADLQVDDGTPADVDGTDLVCDTTPAEDESMGGDPTLADGDRLDLAIASVSGSPTWLSICWTVNYDF